MEDKTIILAADHNGVELKRHITEYLRVIGYCPIDLGPYTIEKVDYVDYARQLGQIVDKEDVHKGILVCGTGQGMAIVANKFQKVRAALVNNLDVAEKSKDHNDANVLCLGAWYLSPKGMEEILYSWLKTPFGEGRHVPRIEKIYSNRPSSIVFTNGCFDIIHNGHIELLNFAKSLGGKDGKLVVGLNSDNSVKRLKGEDRPINNQNDRKLILESLVAVDEVIVFDDEDTKELIKIITPNILVKGGEWTKEEVIERDNIPDFIEVKIFPLKEGYSTTNIVKKISSRIK